MDIPKNNFELIHRAITILSLYYRKYVRNKIFKALNAAAYQG